MPFVTTIRLPVAGPYPSGVFINNAAGYPAGTTAVMTCDDVYATAGDATHIFIRNQEVWAKNTAKPSNPIEFLGTTTNTTATNVRCNIGGGTKFAIADNDELYTIDPGAVSFALALNKGLTLAPLTTSIEITEDGRGMLCFTYFEFT